MRLLYWGLIIFTGIFQDLALMQENLLAHGKMGAKWRSCVQTIQKIIDQFILVKMKMLLKSIPLMLLWGMLIMIAVSTETYAQGLSNISEIQVDELSDQQIGELLERAAQSGLSQDDLLEMASQRGMPQEEVKKLRERIEAYKEGKAISSRRNELSSRQPRKQVGQTEIANGTFTYQNAGSNQPNLPYFGLDLFYQKERNLTFEPSLNLATPKSYVLGPGDVVYVDVYGASEKYYEARVSPEGVILLENIGPISVSGLSMEEASKVIKNRLSSFYKDIRGNNPATFVQVSLGDIRSIKVHMVGELRQPGTYTLSAFSTVFNALYAAGGPNKNGTMRNIKVIRDDKEVAQIDAYEFLVEGKANMGIQLQDQDVILVEPYKERATLNGAVKRSMVFEVKPGETFSDLLEFAGGFEDNAYTEKVSLIRNTNKEKVVSDIYQEQFSIFTVQGGDQFQVGRILDRYKNRVQIKGAVFREGNYALTDDLTLSKLIKKAEGLKGEAYLERASILRTHEDLTTSILQVNLTQVMEGENDIELKADDIVRIASIYDLKDEYYLKVSGEVRDPGVYPFSSDMTVEDLIVYAGGFKESASIKDIEIARRLPDQGNGQIAQLIPVSVNEDLSLSNVSEDLRPFDHIIVRKKPNFALEKVVKVEGQVNAPGEFALKGAEDRISDVIKRAGGLTGFAYVKGATLIRRTEYYETVSSKARRQKNLEKLLDRLPQEGEEPTEAQSSLRKRLIRNTQNHNEPGQEDSDLVIESRTETLKDITAEEGISSDIKIKEREAIAIDLEEILQNPGSKYDLILEEGDIISVPKQLQTVRMRGDVIYPTTVRYENNRSMKYYINRAGGFDNRAKRKRTYVVYANGEVSRTKNFLFLNFYPKVSPGSEVIVPSKGPKIPIKIGELVGLTSGLATLVLVISQINGN